MKNLILSLVMLVSSFVCFSQVYDVSFSEFTNFNSGSHGTYAEVIDSKNYGGSLVRHGLNRYVIDLTNNTLHAYFPGGFEKLDTMLTTKKDGDLVFVTVNSNEDSTGKNDICTIVINTNENNKLYPKFVLSFLSTVTNTINGAIAMK